MEPAAVVDSCVVIHLLKAKIDKERVKSLAKSLYIAAPIKYELLSGAKEEKTRKSILSIPCIDLDCNAARIAGEIQRELYKEGDPAGNMDTLIAAICIANNIPLITTDQGFRKFQRFGLRILTP